MKPVSLSAFFAGSLLLFTGAQAALACDFFVQEHQLDPNEVGVDTTAPEVVIDRVRIEEGSEQNGACAGRNSCYDIGTITIEIGTISDDRTPAEEMGYRVEIDGDFPGESSLEGEVIRADNGVLSLTFIDPDPENKDSWDFSLRVIAVDLAGNESEPSRDFSFEQEAEEAGCRADDGGADQAWLFAPFVPWLWSRRRRTEASDDESAL